MATNYVLSFRVPSDYEPGAETPAEWQAWLRVGGGVEVGPAMEVPAS